MRCALVLACRERLGRVQMKIERCSIPDVLTIEPTRFQDARGFFSEIFRLEDFVLHAGPFNFVQENQSLSARAGTIRGLHFQAPGHVQGKLVRVARGAVLDVAVDIRVGSPSFGQHVAVELSADNFRQLWVPPGFAHGFCTREPMTEVIYKVTDYYSQPDDRGLAWDDPALHIDWGISRSHVVCSDKDARQPRLSELPSYFRF
jgi:dTDP-4-dehydrorhamnose 3,5-epimerase